MKLYAQAMPEENPYQLPLSQEKVKAVCEESAPIGIVSFIIVLVIALILSFLVLGFIFMLGITLFEAKGGVSGNLATVPTMKQRLVHAIFPGALLIAFSIPLYHCLRYLQRWVRQTINQFRS